MELDVFVSESLKAIFKGTKEAQAFAKECGGRINPIRVPANTESYVNNIVYFGKEDAARPYTVIEFDVAVSASSQQESGIKGGINVMSISLGGGNKAAQTNESVSRIKFLLGVVLPHELS